MPTSNKNHSSNWTVIPILLFWNLILAITISLFWFLMFNLGFGEGLGLQLMLLGGTITLGVIIFSIVFGLWLTAHEVKLPVAVAVPSEEVHKTAVLAEGRRNQITTILHSIIDGVLALDLEGKVISVNPAAVKMLNLEGEDVVGKNLDEILTLSENNGPLLVKDLLPQGDVLEDRTITEKKSIKIQNVLKPVSPAVFVDLTSAAIKEGREMNMGAILTLNNVTNQKQLEEMKLDFVSMAAHELRTPITSVRGYISVLMDELNKKITPEQYSFLNKAFISSTQLAGLVENLLSVARIERGALQIQAQALPWEPLVEEVYNNFIPQAKEREVKLKLVKPKKKLPAVLVDKFRVTEVVSNLIGNALNYTPSGGSVEISLEANATEVITHIKDTGQGIPAPALPKLFTKFFRVSGVLEQGSKGTGLGLYISKAIVDMHKGRIWVESEVNKGSTFSFSVPRATTQKLRTVTPGKHTFSRKRAA